MISRLIAVASILLFIFTVNSRADQRIASSGYLPDADMTKDLKAGDLIYVTDGIECYEYRADDYHCVKLIGWRSARTAIVHTSSVTGNLAQYLKENCAGWKLSTRSYNCFFDIIFKLRHVSTDPMGSIRTYETDSIEILKSKR